MLYNLLNKENLVNYLLILIAIATTWLVFNMLQSPIATANKPHHPDSYMLNAIATRMNKDDGTPQDTLQAPKLVHYPENDTTDITQPHLSVFNSNAEPWNIYADTGQAQQGIDVIQLNGHVRLIQKAGSNNDPMTITTTAMTIFPQPQQAQTDQPITLWQPTGTVHSVGMKADLNTGEINLLHQATGHYLDQNK